MQATKRKGRVWIIALVIVAALAAAFVLLRHFGVIGRAASSGATYTLAAVTRGDISQTITATGTLAAGGTADETAPAALTVTEYEVKAGDQVKAGDAVAKLDSASLDSAISTLQSGISSLNSQLASLSNNHSTTGYVTSSYNGRVKAVLAAAGDDAQGKAENDGALLILSTDGKMKVETALSGGISQWATVSAVVGGTAYTGTVESVAQDGTATVTFTDYGPQIGDSVVIKDAGGNEIGSGTAAVNAPVSVVAGSGGTISKIYVSADQKVYSGTYLLYLTNIPLPADFSALSAQRDDDMAQLTQALRLRDSLVLTASQDGVVEALGGSAAASASSGASAASADVSLNAGDTVLTLYTGGATSLSVNVDELDIGSVNLDQQATVTLDAISGQSFTGKVTSIAAAGTSSSGVTTYPVTITLEPNDAFKIGMNASATIVVQQSTDALLVPLGALQYSGGQQYVWVSDGTLPTDPNADPGTKTPVTTGMSNADYAEVTSGLKEGDQVVVVRAASADSSGSTGGTTQGGGFLTGGGTGGTFGGGGVTTRQSGGYTGGGTAPRG